MAENKKPENPNAFACAAGDEFLQEGMSLRDYFAARAMQALIDEPIINNGKSSPAEILARQSYIVADAMLKERES